MPQLGHGKPVVALNKHKFSTGKFLLKLTQNIKSIHYGTIKNLVEDNIILNAIHIKAIIIKGLYNSLY